MRSVAPALPFILLLLSLPGCESEPGLRDETDGVSGTVLIEREAFGSTGSPSPSGLLVLGVSVPGNVQREYTVLIGDAITAECAADSMELDGVDMATVRVDSGWAYFAGTRPLGKGRRVRVHGSGTRFVIKSSLVGGTDVDKVFLLDENDIGIYIDVTVPDVTGVTTPIIPRMRATKNTYLEIHFDTAGYHVDGPKPVPQAEQAFLDGVITAAKNAGVY